jgi:hypothetical protein
MIDIGCRLFMQTLQSLQSMQAHAAQLPPQARYCMTQIHSRLDAVERGSLLLT